MNMMVALVLFLISFVTWILSWIGVYRWTEEYGGKEESERGRKQALIFLPISVCLTVYWMWVWIPWFQPIFFHMFFAVAGLWLVWLIIAASATLIGLFVGWGRKNRGLGIKTAVIVFAVFFFGWWIACSALGDSWTKDKIYNSLNYSELKELPNTTGIRYLPMEVAWRQGENRLQEPRVKHIDADPLVVGDEVYWLLTRGPNGIWNEWLRNADGFTIIDNKGDVTAVRQKMKYGEGMLGSDNILWKLRQQRYWSKITEIYYPQGKNGEVVAIAPYLYYSLSFPVMIPRWGGVFLVYSNGSIEDLKPQEALEHPLLKDVRVFPEELARIYVESYAYKNGIGNVIFNHEDQIVVPKVGIASTSGGVSSYRVNEMPFLLPTEMGQKWFVAAVPWGAEGIYRIFLVDARKEGQIDIFALDENSALIGPNRARGYIVSAYPYFNWDKLLILEPRPIIREGILYWMFTITPTDFAGITDTVLVNSQTAEILSFGSNEDPLVRFLHGEETGKLVGIGETPFAPPAAQVQQPTVPGVTEISPEKLQEVINQLKQLTQTLEDMQKSMPQTEKK